MPIYKCVIRAELEGLAEVRPVPGRSWCLRVSCGKCRELQQNFIEVSPDEEVEVQGGKSNAFFKCKECKNGISISIVPSTEGAFNEEGGRVIEFDVRGGEPVELLLDDKWTAVGLGEAATLFDNVTLNGDFADYDEASSSSVTVSHVVANFVRK